MSRSQIWDGSQWVDMTSATGGGVTDHNDLTGVTASQHHVRYSDAEAQAAVGSIPVNLGDLLDVDTSGANEGQRLAFDGLLWSPRYSVSALGFAEFPYRVGSGTAGQPAPGRIEGNTDTGETNTIIYINEENSDGVDITLFLENLNTGDWINFHDADDVANKFIKYDIIAQPYHDGTDVWVLPVQFYDRDGDYFDANDRGRLFMRFNAPEPFSGSHGDLSGVTSDQHHLRYSDGEAVAAGNATFIRLDGVNGPAQRFDVEISAAPTDPGVGFPGEPGSYIETEDVNLIEADSAHMQQGIGGWRAVSAYVSAPVQSQDLTPKIGDYIGKAVTTGASGNAVIQCNPDTPIPVTPGQVISHGIWLQGIGALNGMEVRTLQTFHTDTNGWVSQVIPASYVTISDGEWVWYKGENITVPAGAATCRLRLEWRQINNSPSPDGDAIYWDGYTLVDGATAPDTQVASLNCNPTDDTASPSDFGVVGYTGYGDPFRLGESWLGTAQSFVRRDGAGGPIVCSWDADEARAAIDGAQSSYVGADGRTYLIVGNLTSEDGSSGGGGGVSPVATLADIATGGIELSHDELTGVTASQHHTRYSDSEAIAAVGPVVEEAPNDGNEYVRKQLGWVVNSGAGGFSGDHADLTNVQADQHHSRYTNAEAIAAAAGAGNFLPLSGGTLTGHLYMSGQNIYDVTNIIGAPNASFNIYGGEGSDTVFFRKRDGAIKFGLSSAGDILMRNDAGSTGAFWDESEATFTVVQNTAVGLSIPYGSQGQPGLFFGSDPDTGIRRPDADAVSLVAGALDVMIVRPDTAGVREYSDANMGTYALRNIWIGSSTPSGAKKGDLWIKSS